MQVLSHVKSWVQKNLEKIPVAVLLIAIPFNIVYHFYSGRAYVDGYFVNYLDFVLHVVDLGAFAFVVYYILVKRVYAKREFFLPVLVFFGFLVLHNVVFHDPLVLYTSARLLLYCALTMCVMSDVVTSKKKSEGMSWQIGLLLGLGVFESVLALFQFLLGKSVGLKFLGESILHIGSVASSSIFLPGGTFLRGYGTFPHPNILGAFLVIVLAASLNEILMKKNGRPRLALTICSGLMTLIVAGGIFLTFSRIAWLCGLFIVLLFTGFVLFRYRRKILPYFLVSVSVVIVLGISWMNLSKRPLAENLRERIVEQSMGSDYSMSERREFNEQAIKLIKKSPLIGNGLGRYIVSAKDMPIYNNYGVRLMQPVHNVFLLILSEVGVLGVVCLTAVVVLALIQNRSASRRTQKFKPSPFLLISFIPLFVLASLFDHYLWTLPQGLTLWILAVYLLRAQGQVQGSTLR